MAVDDDTQTLPATTTDKIIPFTIPHKVPIKLDLKKHNYNAWSSFSLIHLGSAGLKSHVESDTSSTTPEWSQHDDLIKMWILSSLCDPLQEQVVTTPGNAKALWDRLKKLFHDNKDSRTINLDNELCSIKIGNMSVNAYCTKIQSMADRLMNLGTDVSDKNLVIYTVNGLDSRFATLVEIIRNRDTLPTFETTRTMLLLKESSFTSDSEANTTFEGTSSSPSALLTSTSTNSKSTNTKTPTIPQICNHFNRGTCKFGDRCKFIHDHRNRAGLSSTRQQSRGGPSSLAGIWNNSDVPTHFRSATHVAHYRSPAIQPSPAAYFTSPHQQAPATWAQLQPTPAYTAHQPMQHLTYPAHQPTSAHSTAGLLGPVPTSYPTQATSIPSAFSTMTVQDPTWNMDTGLLDSPYPPPM